MLQGASAQSCKLTTDLQLRRPEPAKDISHSCLLGVWGGAKLQGWGCHFISMSGRSPTKSEVTVPT